jgi:hypothetical protein
VVASAVAGLNAGAHIALVPSSQPLDNAAEFAMVLVEAAAYGGFCVGSVNLYGTAGALVPLRQLLQARYLQDLWLLLSQPSSAAISRAVDEVRELWNSSDARLLITTTHEHLRAADLPPAARRALIPMQV